MFGMQHQCQVKDIGFKTAVVLALEHVEEVFRGAQFRIRMAEDQRFLLIGMPETKVYVGCYNREFGDQVKGLLQEVDVGIIFRFIILGVHRQYRAGQHIHDVFPPEGKDQVHKAVGQIPLVSHVGGKDFQVILAGQLTGEQQVNGLVKAMPFIFLKSVH